MRNKRRVIPGFDESRRYETCPDCNLREALTRTIQRPQHDSDPFRRRALRQGRTIGIRFSPITVDACEGCKGRGEILRAKKGDPYDRDAMHPVEAAKKSNKKRKKKRK